MYGIRTTTAWRKLPSNDKDGRAWFRYVPERSTGGERVTRIIEPTHAVKISIPAIGNENSKENMGRKAYCSCHCIPTCFSFIFIKEEIGILHYRVTIRGKDENSHSVVDVKMKQESLRITSSSSSRLRTLLTYLRCTFITHSSGRRHWGVINQLPRAMNVQYTYKTKFSRWGLHTL